MARLSRFVVIAACVVSAVAVPDVSDAADRYVVQNGDTLFGIAAKLDVRLSALLSANDLRATSMIHPGQRLTVPGAANRPAVRSGGSTYTVREGDWLSRIAERHGISLSALLAANNLTASSLIQPGQRLTIPGGGSQTPSAGSGAGTTYTVRGGDWLARIADRHGISLSALLSANGLTPTSLIHPGQQLTIPGGAAPSSPSRSGGTSYTVKAGDWLARIAERHGVSLSALLAANNLTASSVILPGQKLTIPGGASRAPDPSGSTARGPVYTVQAGDALSSIAARHRVTLDSLLDLNGLTVNSMIVPGQRLTLPKGAVATSRSTGTGVDRVVRFALAQQGKPYRFFTAGPNTFDCSGLTLAAYSQIGVTLVHHSASQARQGRAVDFWSEPIRAGDLIFLATRGSSRINHVGMAVSATTWIQARRPGDVVRLAPLPPKGIITAVRRYVPAG